MTKLSMKQKFWTAIVLVVGGLFFGGFSFLFAQSNDAISTTNSGSTAIAGALKELSAIYGQTISTTAEAKAVCDKEQFIADCGAIGKKYGLFQKSKVAQVDAMLSELKGQVLDDLKNCTDAECLLGVAEKLAKNLGDKHPFVAKELDLTPKKIQEVQTLADVAKGLGVDIETCKNLDPETAPVETLRSCAMLAKSQNIQPQGIGSQTIRNNNSLDATLSLRESLAKGEFQCGDNTVDGCGNYCLHPDSATQSQGIEAIPPVCRQIAEKFFAPNGIKELERAYTQVGDATSQFKKQADNVIFTTVDGQTLTDPAAIGKYMEEQAQSGNVDAVEKGMDFMVAKGLVSREEKDFALQMVNKIKKEGHQIDFNKCAADPQSCQGFIPDNQQGDFNSSQKVEAIIRGELQKQGVSDPRMCQNAGPDVGNLCIAGMTAALPQIELLGNESPDAKNIAAHIKEQIAFSHSAQDAKDHVEEKIKNDGGITIGDQKFTNFQDLQNFCQQNGQLCLAESAKEGIISKDFAAKKFNASLNAQFGNQVPQTFPGNSNFQNQTPEQHGQLFDQNMRPQMQGGVGFPSRQNQQGPQDFYHEGTQGQVLNKEDALQKFKAWLDNPNGAPPIPELYRQNQQQNQNSSENGAINPQQFPQNNSGQFQGPPDQQGQNQNWQGRPTPEEMKKFYEQNGSMPRQWHGSGQTNDDSQKNWQQNGAFPPNQNQMPPNQQGQFQGRPDQVPNGGFQWQQPPQFMNGQQRPDQNSPHPFFQGDQYRPQNQNNGQPYPNQFPQQQPDKPGSIPSGQYPQQFMNGQPGQFQGRPDQAPGEGFQGQQPPQFINQQQQGQPFINPPDGSAPFNGSGPAPMLPSTGAPTAPSPTSFLFQRTMCVTGYVWNGTYCVARPHTFGSILDGFMSITALFGAIFR